MTGTEDDKSTVRCFEASLAREPNGGTVFLVDGRIHPISTTLVLSSF